MVTSHTPNGQQIRMGQPETFVNGLFSAFVGQLGAVALNVQSTDNVDAFVFVTSVI